MRFANENECRAADLDPKKVEEIAKQLHAVAKAANRLGITIFGGSGSGSLRKNDKPGDSYSRPLILADVGCTNFDGGDGGFGGAGDDGLIRGE